MADPTALAELPLVDVVRHLREGAKLAEPTLQEAVRIMSPNPNIVGPLLARKKLAQAMRQAADLLATTEPVLTIRAVRCGTCKGTGKMTIYSSTDPEVETAHPINCPTCANGPEPGWAWPDDIITSVVEGIDKAMRVAIDMRRMGIEESVRHRFVATAAIDALYTAQKGAGDG